MFPERQRHPHTDWKDEVVFLDKIFGMDQLVEQLNKYY